MPYTMRKVKNKNCYRITNIGEKRRSSKTRRVFAKCSTKENAKKQLRLLRAIHYNKNFTLRARSK